MSIIVSYIETNHLLWQIISDTVFCFSHGIPTNTINRDHQLLAWDPTHRNGGLGSTKGVSGVRAHERHEEQLSVCLSIPPTQTEAPTNGRTLVF